MKGVHTAVAVEEALCVLRQARGGLGPTDEAICRRKRLPCLPHKMRHVWKKSVIAPTCFLSVLASMLSGAILTAYFAVVVVAIVDPSFVY